MSSAVTCRLIVSVFGAVLGSFQFGFNTGVINAPESSIKDFLNETEYDRTGQAMSSSKSTNLFALIVAIFAAGGCIGGLMAGWWANVLGRKKGFIVNACIGTVASVFMFFSKMAGSYEMIIVGRFIIGYSCGLYTGLTPMYLSEIAPIKIRGALGVLHQLGVVCGILVSQILGFPEILGNIRLWDVLLGLAFFPCVIQLLIFPLCPESPRFLLISKGEESKARDVLALLRGSNEIEDDIREMKTEASSESSEDKVSISQLILSQAHRRPLIISIVMQLSQQLSGINGIFYYSASLFKSTGLSTTSATHATSGVGGVMVIMTIITIPLIDRAGRRSLHLIGLGGMFVFSILMTVVLSLRHTVHWFNALSIVMSLLYVLFFALGPGSIPWLIVAELFSQGPRPAAMSVAVCVNWVSNFVVGYSFPHLQNLLGDYTFVAFSVLLFLFFLFTFFVVPETKNRTIEEISQLWKSGGKSGNSYTLQNTIPDEKPSDDNEDKSKLMHHKDNVA